MAYNAFAQWYDALNTDADYGRLMSYIYSRLEKYGITGGIVADLGCGTGEVSLRLAAAGYEVIGIDSSPDMLAVLHSKAAERGRGDILLLCQDLAELDLYGTVGAAVSVYDTFNHLTQEKLAMALGRIALFTEPDGVLIFDVNTVYKHKIILANRTFEAAASTVNGLYCEWQNRTSDKNFDTDICLTVYKDGKAVAYEEFTEYCHTQASLEKLLRCAGYSILSIIDGETFTAPSGTSQRLLYVVQRRKK